MNLSAEAPGKQPGSRPRRRVRAKTVLVSLAPVLLATALAACSSSSTPSASSSTSATASANSTTSSTSAAQAKVTAGEAAPSAPVPTAPLTGISKLKGKTIYYVPISSDVPAFAITAAAMKSALATVGVNLDVCSGNFNPSQMTACVQQGIASGAAAVVTDSVPWQLTSSLLKEGAAKGVAMIVTDQDVNSTAPQAKGIVYISGADNQYTLVQDWIAADSGGKADILELQDTDTPTTSAAWTTWSEPEIKKVCPACTETVLQFSSSNEQDLPSLISSALLKNPNINYIAPQYDQYTSYVLQGVQEASATSRVKIAAAASAMSGLQDVAESSSPVKAEVADNQVYNGWMDADAAMRQALGLAPYSGYYIPIRLFDSTNIGSITLNNANQASGSWFGSTSYEQEFEQLWGVG